MGALRPLAAFLGGLLLLGFAACRLPAREVRWDVSGSERTWLASLGERRERDLVIRLWVADRAMWPLPLPASRELFFGDDDLFALILVDNEGTAEVKLEPGRIRLREGRPARVRGPARLSDSCSRTVAPDGRGACGAELSVWRGAGTVELDLTDALPSSDRPVVFLLQRRGSWIWQRVGPGVPGL
jgi:hypothetical protein